VIVLLPQVLQAVVGCEAGVYLSDESICKAYQAAFILGDLDADVRAAKGSQVGVGGRVCTISGQAGGEVCWDGTCLRWCRL
jgi:hypothetical protein